MRRGNLLTSANESSAYGRNSQTSVTAITSPTGGMGNFGCNDHHQKASKRTQQSEYKAILDKQKEQHTEFQ